MARPPLMASSISRMEDSRPAPSGITAWGNSTASRRGSTETISGTPLWNPGCAASAFSSSAIDRPFRARSEQIHGLQLTRGRSHQRLAAIPADLIGHLAHLRPNVVRQALDLRLHVEHPTPHL